MVNREKNHRDSNETGERISEEPDNKLLKFLNSAFFVTIMGGVFVTLISLLWQSNEARWQQRKAEELKLFEARQKLLVEFADSFPLSLNLALQFKQRELWLRIQQHTKEKGMFADGRNFSETRDYYEKSLDQYLKNRTPDSLIAQVNATFDKDFVKRKAETLDKIMDALIMAETKEDLEKLYYEADELYQELITQMGKEIKGYEK